MKLVRDLSDVDDAAAMKHAKLLASIEAAHKEKSSETRKSYDDLRTDYSIVNHKCCKLAKDNACRAQHVSHAGVP
jgi:hypothetical protein